MCQTGTVYREEWTYRIALEVGEASVVEIPVVPILSKSNDTIRSGVNLGATCVVDAD
jgi:hypothetical protein